MKKFEKAIPILFLGILIFGIVQSSQNNFIVVNQLVQKSLGQIILVFAMLLPITMGVGINFSIIVGAMAGQLGAILSLNMGLDGGISVFVGLLIATCIALIIGFPVAYCMKRAERNAVLLSLFIAYFTNGLYQFLTLNMFGTIIRVHREDLLLQSGSGLRNTIALEGFKYLAQINVLIVLALFFFCSLMIKLYKSKDKIHNYNTESGLAFRSRQLRPFIKEIIYLLLTLFLLWGPLPQELTLFRRIQVSIVPVILSLIVYVIVRFVQSRFKGIEDKRDQTSYMRYKTIIVIMTSIVLASWGQLMNIQSAGSFTTYGSHLGVANMALLALIIGGAKLDTAQSKHVLIGCFLLQGFTLVWPEISAALLGDFLSIEPLRTLIINGLIIYALVVDKGRKGQNTKTDIS